MANAAGTVELLALELGKACEPLSELLSQDMFERLGMPLPSSIAGDGAVANKLTAAGQVAAAMPPLVSSLVAAIAAENTANIIAASAPLIAKIAELVARLKEAGDALHQAANGLPAVEKDKIQAFASAFAIRTLEYVAVGNLNNRMPTLANSLTVLGIVDKEYEVPTAIEAPDAPQQVIARRFYVDRIPQMLTKPEQYFNDVFKWGNAAFDGSMLLQKLHALLESMGVPAVLYFETGKPPVLEAYFFSVTVDETVSPPGIKLALSLPGNTDFTQEVALSDLWKATVAAKASFAAGMDATIRPPLSVTVSPPTGNVNINLLLGIKAEKSSGDPIMIIGLTGSSGLFAKSIGASIGVNASLGSSGGSIDPAIQFAIKEGKFKIDFSEGDGFIQSILSGIKLDADFELLGNWDPKSGLRFQGNAGVEVFIPVHLDLLVIQLNGLYFSIGTSTEAPLRIGLAAQLTTKLGPLTAVVDRIGTRVDISFPEDGNGKLGMADIAFSFMPPKGVGLSMDTGVITGGGFLSLDFEKGEYFGALELTFQGFISLKAIAIINTKMPDGRDGFALLILVTAEFTPIQLSFGFTLNGVGGLLALNRSVNTEAVKTGVRTSAINSIMFPQDIVANIHRIISDLKTIFPIVEGHFVIAPMAKLGWGTPPLITLELGIILDIPRPQFIILGVLRCILPHEEAALLKLQVNFAGGVDFDKKMIWFDASLFDSRLLIYVLTGDMALRIGFGEQPLFVLSVGGFHPAFKEVPPDLTGMRRIGIALMSGDNPRIAAMTYFAVTSNTVQSGARVELFAEACGFNVYGFLGYDLLVQFSPFHFVADISAGLALRSGTSEIMGIGVHLQLSGPTPWRAVGDGHINMLFFEISVGFDITWGDDPPPQPQELEDVFKLVSDALRDDRNWKADLPANTNQAVTIKKIELPPEHIIIHPFGILSVSQKIVPLGFDINKFGNKKPKDATKFDLTTAASSEQVEEEFAIANFIALSDSEKLSRASFERKKSGLRFSVATADKYGAGAAKEVVYELSYVHKKRRLSFKFGLFRLFTDVVAVLVKGNAIHQNNYSASKRQATIAPSTITMQPAKYMVVNVSDLALHQPELVAASQSEAYMMQETLISKNPSLKGSIQVISEHELN